jgi:ribosomal protein S18 acetylase RimI-like enzyme
MKGKDITIRPGSLNDLEALIDLEKKAFSTDRFDRQQYIYLLTKARASVIVLEKEGSVRGAAVMLWRKNSNKGRLYNIVVDPTLQRMGMGAILLGACEREALKRNRTIVSLEVRSDNLSAVRFYEERGYKVAANLPGYYSDGGDGLRMSKTLDRA